ncbi:30S ribosomal protein S7 [Patescibacteria group bacterium]|nr:30S ribosomal protein S7 [Patescibacteria group bacterium]MBU1034885.1 30S ribosomal protein S7 [Patescibacteria group bacterium]MBU1629919.1 30S ribosomal protein S7 [Patescibacteria group bacterium]MBU1908135.1 30S ribosomal protein S7 [Patescibacteria group bacterium]
MRGKKAPRRKISNDSKYGSPVVGKFVNYIMSNGKKTTAQKIVYTAFDILEEKTKKPALEVFNEALNNISPLLEVKSKRVGGANYQIPMQVRAERRQQLAFRWLIAAARGKKGKPMAEKLAAEFLAAAENQGDAVKKKQDVQRMAEANRAFAHFAR